MKRSLIIVMLALPLIAGCAGASKASSEESEAAKAFQAPPDRGGVYLYRTGRLVGASSAIEVEVNGLMTYDREVMKIDVGRAAEAAKELYSPVKSSGKGKGTEE